MDTHDRARERESVTLGRHVLSGRGDGTYDEALAAIRVLIADVPSRDDAYFATTPATDQPQPAGVAISEGKATDTVAFVQEWLMNADYDPTQFDRDFAAAIDARCAAYTPKPADAQPAGVPDMVLGWISPDQLAKIADAPAGEGGNYLPVRKTRDGNFTLPIFAQPAASDQRAEVEALKAALREAEAQFEGIRTTLIDALHEPERRAFWDAVNARNAIRDLFARAALASTSHDAAMGDG